MPTIPFLTARPEVPGAPRVPTRALESAGAEFGALARTGQALAEVAGNVAAAQNDAYAAQSVAQLRATLGRNYLDAQAAAAPDAANFTSDVLGVFDTALAQTLEAAPGPRARRFVQERAASLRAEYETRAYGWELERRAAHAARGNLEAIHTLGAAVRADPDSFAGAMRDLEAGIRGNTALPAERQDQLLEAGRRELTIARGQALIDRNPAAARREFTRGEFASNLNQAQREALINGSEAEERRRDAEGRREAADRDRAERASLQADLREDLASANASGRGSGANGAFRVDERRIRRVLNDDPDAAARAIEQLRGARDGYAIRQRLLEGLSPEERRREVEAARASIERREGGEDDGQDVIRLSPQDVEDLTRIAIAEAGNQPYEGLTAVVYTVLNRLRTGRFGASVREVINARNQFEPATRAGGVENLPQGRPAQRQILGQIIRDIAQGVLDDPSDGALFFLNREISAQRGTDFGRDNDDNFVGQIGQHHFYRALRGGPQIAVPVFRVAIGDEAARGGAERAHIAELTQREVQRFEEALARDPGGLALQNPGVRRAFADAAAAPDDHAAYERAVTASIDWQRRAGVEPHDVRPLPRETAERIASRINAAPNAREGLRLLRASANAWDPAIRGAIVQQLETAGAADARLPEGMGLVLEIADDPAREGVAERLLGELMEAKRSTRELAREDRRSLDERVNQIMAGADVQQVRQAQYEATGDARYLARRRRDRELVAHVATLRGGTNEATTAAASDLFGHLDAINRPGEALVTFARGSADADTVRAGLQLARAEIKQALVARIPAEATELQRRQALRTIDAMVDDGVWVNYGSGFALRSGTGTEMLTRDREGSQVWTLDAREAVDLVRGADTAREQQRLLDVERAGRALRGGRPDNGELPP